MREVRMRLLFYLVPPLCADWHWPWLDNRPVGARAKKKAYSWQLQREVSVQGKPFNAPEEGSHMDLKAGNRVRRT